VLGVAAISPYVDEVAPYFWKEGVGCLKILSDNYFHTKISDILITIIIIII
jgi:hypothetical protein